MALRYWVPGGNGNYNSTTNWSSANGGASGASVPTSNDDAIFNNNSGSGIAIINVSSNAKTINFTGFLGAVDFRNTLNVAGNVTLGVNMSFQNTSGVAVLNITGSSNLTSNGKNFPYELRFSETQQSTIMTFTDNWIVGSINHAGSAILSINNNTVYINNNLINSSTNRTQGSTTFVMQGSGTLSSNSITGSFRNLIINTAGIITISDTVTPTANGVWNYTAGTVITNNSTLSLYNSSTINLDGIIFNNIGYYEGTTTLLSNLTYIGMFDRVLNASVPKTFNGFTIKHIGSSGGLRNNASDLQGSTIISLEGGGVISSYSLANSIAIPLTINTLGSYTVASNLTNFLLPIAGCIFTYTAGNLAFDSVNGGFVISKSNLTTTFNGLSNNQLPELVINGNLNSTIVLNDVFTTNTIRFADNSTNCIFEGDSGFICDSLKLPINSINIDITLKGGVEYHIMNEFISGSLQSYNSIEKPEIKSANSLNKAKLILSPGAFQELSYTTFNNIDASQGATIWTFGKFPIYDCLNINSFTQPSNVGF
jgi:hypothetical protein